MKGKVYLVGSGPGDPELLTVKALRLLQTAQAVLYDELVAPGILRLIPSTAQIHNVGKRCGTKKVRQEEINFLMVTLADSGVNVVRLKSGDPLIFGRAGEEMEALRKADVPFEIVPGVTSVLGAAASAQIPLTHRRASSAVVLLTAHRAAGSEEEGNWSKLAASGATLVIYMPGNNYAETSRKLKRSGLMPETPCAIISKATTAEQQTHFTTIQKLRNAPQFEAPNLLVVGEVVRLGKSAVESAGLASPGIEFAVPTALLEDFPFDMPRQKDEEPTA